MSVMAFSSISDDNVGLELEMIDPRVSKEEEILECERNGSIWELREMALSRGGLVNGKQAF